MNKHDVNRVSDDDISFMVYTDKEATQATDGDKQADINTPLRLPPRKRKKEGKSETDNSATASQTS